MASLRLPLLLLLALCVLLLVSTPTRVSAAAAKKKKLTEADLAAIEDQWMEDEEETEDDMPFKYTKSPDGSRVPPAPGGPKTEMGFVTITGEKNKKRTDELAGRWADQMLAAGIDVRGYTIEDNRILFVCDQRGFKDMNRVRHFLLGQPETLEFEWNTKKYQPGSIINDDDGEVSADPMSRFQNIQDEQARAAKREARQKKKAKEAKAAKKKLAKQKAEKKKKEAAAKAAKAKAAEAAAAAKQPQEKTEL